MKVLILGAGNMVGSILQGLTNKLDMSEWSIYSPTGVSAQKLAEKCGARALSDLSLIERPEWILLGCKPQQLGDLKKTLNGKFQDSLYVSLLAAVSEEQQLKTLNVKSLIRVMPNLAVKYNQGVTLMSSKSAQGQFSRIEEIFHLLGAVQKLDESSFEELTLLTGSGPALFYEFTKLLAENFSSLSLSEREHLARKVLAGAAVSVGNDERPLSALTDTVTSKGGVTIAVLEEWRKQNLSGLLKSGVEAGKKRTSELKALLQS